MRPHELQAFGLRHFCKEPRLQYGHQRHRMLQVLRPQIAPVQPIEYHLPRLILTVNRCMRDAAIEQLHIRNRAYLQYLRTCRKANVPYMTRIHTHSRQSMLKEFNLRSRNHSIGLQRNLISNISHLLRRDRLARYIDPNLLRRTFRQLCLEDPGSGLACCPTPCECWNGSSA